MCCIEYIRSYVRQGILGVVIFLMGATICLHLATIIATPIFHTTAHCLPSSLLPQVLAQTETAQVRAWGIVQAIPLLLAFIIIFSELVFHVSTYFVPDCPEYISRYRVDELLNTKVLPQLYSGRANTQLTRAERREYIIRVVLAKRSATQTISLVRLDQAWKNPRSTLAIKQFARADHDGPATPRLCVPDRRDVLGDDEASMNNNNNNNNTLDQRQQQIPEELLKQIDPTNVWIGLEESWHRKLHSEYYYSNNSMYSLVPQQHYIRSSDMRNKFEWTAFLICVVLLAIHIAFAIWGSVLLGSHWGKGEVCPGSVAIHRFILFELIYSWFIPTSFGIMFVVYHTI